MATPIGNCKYITDLDIRIWLRDTDPTANKLLDDYEFTPEELRTAITLAVDYYNEQPPMVGSYEYPDFPWRYNLLKGTCANLLFIAANDYRRNKLTYNIPGGAVGDKDKDQAYDAAGDRMWREYTSWVTANKRMRNIEQGYGDIG